MKKIFEKMLARQPEKIESGIFYFDAHNHGDFFDESDTAMWDGGRLESNWNNKCWLTNPVARKLVEAIVSGERPVVDIACGPGMGLLPSVKQLDPVFSCVATDANAMVLEHWKRYLDRNHPNYRIGFAQFSVMDMPFMNHSVPAFSGNLGLSSTRNGAEGYDTAVKEVYRCLKPGGYFYTIENEWLDVPAILQVFEKNGMAAWNIFNEEQISWHDRFLQAGFEIVSEKEVQKKYLTEDDNELGEASCKLGIPVGTKQTAFILRKPAN